MYKKKLIACNELELIKIKNKKHILFLYKLLKNRDIECNISHYKNPSIEEHIKFVNSHPYRHWFCIKKENKLLGSVYVTYNNEVSIILFKKNKKNFIKTLKLILSYIKPLPAIPSRRNKNFTLNLSPANKYYSTILRDLGSKKIQETFLLTFNNL